VILAVALGEPTAPAAHRRLGSFAAVLSSPLLEAEVRSALRRSAVEADQKLVGRIQWIFPRRSLRAEIEQVLNAGYVRGADCFHLATALYLAPEPGAMTFLTLDSRQRAVARALGFKT